MIIYIYRVRGPTNNGDKQGINKALLGLDRKQTLPLNVFAVGQ